MRRIGFWIVVCGLSLIGLHSPQAEAAILINEVLADPAGDANGDGSVHSTRDEFVELVNTGPTSVPLSHWTLSDLVQVRHVFAEDTLISGRGFFVVFGGGTPQGFMDFATASSGGLGLNNPGDTLTLRDASASLIDSFAYGPEGGMDVSLARSPDATGGFVQHSSVSSLAFSPGTTVSGLPTLPVPQDTREPTPPAEPETTEPSPSDTTEPAPSDPSEPAPPEPSSPPNPETPVDLEPAPIPPVDTEPPVAPEPPVTDDLTNLPDLGDLVDPGSPLSPPVDFGPPVTEESGGPHSGPVVPEPSSLLLLGCGVFGLPWIRRRPA